MPIHATKGEEHAQRTFGSVKRAKAFYANQTLNCLNPLMQEFISAQEMVWIATADADGTCDSSFRAGPPGFIHIVNENIVAYPEYRGNGVMASVGNMFSNPHISLLFIDFFQSTIGLHVNGKARIIDPRRVDEFTDVWPELGPIIEEGGVPRPECWVVVDVEEAYIHCSKHIPRLRKLDKSISWGTDDERFKGGDYFQTKSSRSSGM